jgi:hypothetical protein
MLFPTFFLSFSVSFNLSQLAVSSSSEISIVDELVKIKLTPK